MEREIDLEQLKTMKAVFDGDEEGAAELDMEAFAEKLGPYLSDNLDSTHFAQLFMKIDADCGGTIDWDEFSNFFFLQRGVDTSSDKQDWRLFPMAMRPQKEGAHREVVEHIYHCTAVDRFVTCGRDGMLRVWNPHDLLPTSAVNNGAAWVTACVHLPASRQLACSAADRTVTFYEMSRSGTLNGEAAARVHFGGSMGVPLCLSALGGDWANQERVVIGDSRGWVGTMPSNGHGASSQDAKPAALPRGYQILHQEHSDWVTQVTAVPEMGLVSSSLDSTIKVTDAERRQVLRTVSVHTKGVSCFAHCRAYSLVASGGLERTVMLWQASGGRPIGELLGHSAPVTHLALDNARCQVMSLGADKVIKLWDLRNQRCLQTLVAADWPRKEDASPSCALYDGVRHRLVTAGLQPAVWQHACASDDMGGHREPLVAALFNSAFHVIVSTDEGGTVCMWNVINGQREGFFRNAHGRDRLTAVAFDAAQRRLLTASNRGCVRMWNFNSGSLLREFVHAEEMTEISVLLFVHDAARESNEIVAAGWNHKVYVWNDDDDEVVDDYRTFGGHGEDILCAAHSAGSSGPSLLATGDYEGRINLYDTRSGERRLSLYHRAERYCTAIQCLLFLRPPGAAQHLYLLSCGGDGDVRVWHIGTKGTQVCTLRGAEGSLDTVTAACVNAAQTHVAFGDSAGNIRVYNMAALGDLPGGSEGCSPSMVTQEALWRGHKGTVASIRHVGVDLPGVGVGGLLLSAGRDTSACLWTMTGGLVGRLGVDTWRLDDPTTWQDPYCSRAADGGEASDWLFASSTEATPRDPVSGSATSPDAEASEGGRPVSRMVAVRRLRARENIGNNAKRGEQIYSTLKIHPPSEVPENFADICGPGSGSASSPGGVYAGGSRRLGNGLRARGGRYAGLGKSGRTHVRSTVRSVPG